MRKFLIVITLLAMSAATAQSFAAEKRALVLAVFGTSTEAAITFDELVPLLKKQFHGRDVFVPYTSPVIRNKLNKDRKAADKLLSPEEMFNKLKKDGYTDLFVATTIVFDGVEYEKLKADTDKFAKANKSIKIKLATPLVSSDANISKVVDTLAPYVRKDAINILVAHGTHSGHSVEKRYLAVQKAFEAKYANSYMGTVEGVPSVDSAYEKVKKANDKQVQFLVFMFVAGDHAENDVAGDEEDSMFSAVKKLGKIPSIAKIKVKGKDRMLSLGLIPAYQKLLVEHIAYNATVH
ncbi:hypothetical protein RsTz2092_09250 [Deferribacterales bacterium RsTz2092]|nr:hypothetical protein AGMMS49941_08010 [Deferribacterales bacterium]